MTNYIWVTTQKEMIHHYDDAPEDVNFLKYPHRHLFKIKVYLEVFHNGRDIEFIMFKRWLEKTLNSYGEYLENKSCEMLSDELAEIIAIEYSGREIKIEISEDGENGTFKEYSR